MTAVEIFGVFVVCHLAGDYLLQTDWQARNKRGGLAGPAHARRALVTHVAIYTLAFAPAAIWLASDLEVGLAGLAAAIFVPHLIQDDGRLLSGYIRQVKRVEGAPSSALYAQVDQSMHLVILFLTALGVHAAVT